MYESKEEDGAGGLGGSNKVMLVPIDDPMAVKLDSDKVDATVKVNDSRSQSGDESVLESSPSPR